MLALLLACAPAEYPDYKLDMIHWGEPEPLGTCEVLGDCRSDEFCHEGDCLPHSARSFGVTLLAASVGSVRPDGGDWETSDFATTHAPDLVGAVYWTDPETGEEAGCETAETPNVYYVSWNYSPCWFSAPADQVSMGLGPVGIANGFLEVTLWDVDSFNRDYAASWVWNGVEGAEQLAAMDGQDLRLEKSAESGGESLWMDIGISVEVNP